MNGNKLIGGGPVTLNPGPAWKAIGTGDLDDDGRSDILFQNTSSGQVSIWPIWEMNGNTLIGGGPSAPIPRRVARYRNRRLQRRRPLRHPFSKHERPSLGLGNEWRQPDRRRAVSPNPGSSWRAVA